MYVLWNALFLRQNNQVNKSKMIYNYNNTVLWISHIYHEIRILFSMCTNYVKIKFLRLLLNLHDVHSRGSAALKIWNIDDEIKIHFLCPGCEKWWQ